jgi:hypothetical protein
MIIYREADIILYYNLALHGILKKLKNIIILFTGTNRIITMDQKITELKAILNKIIENFDNQKKEILNLKKIINSFEDKNQNITKPKVNDAIINRLINGKNKSQDWKKGMSKYIGITYVVATKKWIFQSGIFNNSEYFSTKEEAESYYENILTKNNIDFSYVIRNGYVSDQTDSVTGETDAVSGETDAVSGLMMICK